MTVYTCGDHVIYGSHGVCRILSLETRRVDRKQIEYYVLAPADGSEARFYVPIRNEAAVAKLRSVLTEDEVRSLLSSDEIRQHAWIEDEGIRKQRYKELLTGSDRAALVSMVHSLHHHRQQQEAAGRKFHLCDENFLRDAQRLLGSEFALALQIPESEVGDVVKSAIAE